MLPSVVEIKARRLKLGLNQTQLAQSSGVSQSLIAKIESGKTNASYSRIKNLFDALEKLEEKSSIRAVDVMSNKIISVKEEDSIQTAARIMQKHGVSQLVVISKSEVVGSLSEKNVLDKIASGITAEELSQTKIREVMDEAFPTINEDTPLRLISALLENSLALVVKKKNKLVGIITKTDLLKTIK